MKELEASEVRLHKIFSSDFDFRIPEYQRPYAWETEQASQLLDDLVESLDRNEDEPYFLGSIVLVKENSGSSADVIDGQQRLTTLTILLAILRDLTTNPDLAAELDGMIKEPGKIVRGLPSKPRLTLRDRDSKFFDQYVQTHGGVNQLLTLSPDALTNDSQRSIKSNTHALWRVLNNWSEERRLELIRMLGERTFLVVVSTPNLDSAHRIFSVMNARGLDLSPADIFKSLVVGHLPDQTSSEYAEKWEDAEEDLGRDDFADLFLHIRMIFAKDRARRELLKEFPDQVLNQYLPDRAGEFVDDVVVPYAQAYEEIRDQTYTASTGAEEINAWFRRLAQLDNNDWRPPALWALRRHAHEPQWLNDFFRQLERLAASMFLRRVYATPRSMRYADLLRQLDAGEGLCASAFDLSAEEKEDTVDRLNSEIYTVTKVRKYVLLRLDELLSQSSGVTYQHPIITVEHVLPQNPDPNSDWTRLFTEEERKYWTHRVGNLVLLSRTKNSEAQNYEFDEKKRRYFTGKTGISAFALTTQVLRTDQWTPDALASRQEHLVSLLRKEWHLE